MGKSLWAVGILNIYIGTYIYNVGLELYPKRESQKY